MAIAVPLTVACASLTGFAITRLRRPWHGIAIGFTLVCLTIPASALWVPRFAIFRSLDVLDTYVPLIAPALVGHVAAAGAALLLERARRARAT